MKKKKIKFILLRHCETDWNKQHRWQGHTDNSLNDYGRKNAKEIVDLLKEYDLDCAVSSDLARAVETANIICKNLEIPLTIDKRLREYSFGKLEGKKDKKVVEICGKGVLTNLEYDFKKFGGESKKNVLARHLRLLDDLKKSFNNHATLPIVLLVGHGRGLETLLVELGQEPNFNRGEVRVIEY